MYKIFITLSYIILIVLKYENLKWHGCSERAAGSCAMFWRGERLTSGDKDARK